MDENTSYSSQQMDTHEVHNMGSATPFLPAVAGSGATASNSKEFDENRHDYNTAPSAARDMQPAPGRQPPNRHHESPSARGSMASHGASHIAPSPLVTPPSATAQRQHSPPDDVDDEPPSPVSPVSPVSPISSAGSRPTSLRRSGEHHDLR